MSLGSIPELDDERLAIECLLHDAALHSLAAAVNEAHLTEPGFVRGGYILSDDRGNIAWSECVEVYRVFNGDAHLQLKTQNAKLKNAPFTSRRPFLSFEF